MYDNYYMHLRVSTLLRPLVNMRRPHLCTDRAQFRRCNTQTHSLQHTAGLHFNTEINIAIGCELSVVMCRLFVFGETTRRDDTIIQHQMFAQAHRGHRTDQRAQPGGSTTHHYPEGSTENPREHKTTPGRRHRFFCGHAQSDARHLPRGAPRGGGGQFGTVLEAPVCTRKKCFSEEVVCVESLFRYRCFQIGSEQWRRGDRIFRETLRTGKCLRFAG